MKTIVQTEIIGDQWTATTPHAPELRGEDASEAGAVSALVRAIREAIAEAGEQGIEWKANASPGKDKSKITRRLSGCWPPVIKEQPPRKELNDAD